MRKHPVRHATFCYKSASYYKRMTRVPNNWFLCQKYTLIVVQSSCWKNSICDTSQRHDGRIICQQQATEKKKNAMWWKRHTQNQMYQHTRINNIIIFERFVCWKVTFTVSFWGTERMNKTRGAGKRYIWWVYNTKLKLHISLWHILFQVTSLYTVQDQPATCF